MHVEHITPYLVQEKAYPPASALRATARQAIKNKTSQLAALPLATTMQEELQPLIESYFFDVPLHIFLLENQKYHSKMAGRQIAKTRGFNCGDYIHEYLKSLLIRLVGAN